MKIKIINKFILFSLLFSLIIAATIFQSINQDYTSIIDFDLTVIHNSLQLVSNKYPDFVDLTSYSHFLTYGIFYKAFALLDHDLITNIDLLIKLENPELILQKLYVISRITNSIIHFVTIIFIYKILGILKVDEYYKILTIFFIIFSETFLANLIILRSDIVAVCYFFISAYFLLNFIKSTKLSNLFLVSLFMILSLLAKVQIIFLYMFLFFFFVFYFANEKKNIVQKLDHKLMNSLLKYLLIFFIFFYFLFQYYLNNIIDSSTSVGYLDLFCFNIYFFIMFFTILLVFKTKKKLKDNLYNIFALILIFFISQIFILKLLDILNIIKIDFNIIFSITNPFYFLKNHSPFLDKELSYSLIFEMFILLFKDFNFNIIYFFLLSLVLLVSLYRIIFQYKKEPFNYQYIYIFLLAAITLFLSAINNFRYNVSYNIYFIPFFFILLAIFFNLVPKKNKLFFSIVISFFIIFNFAKNSTNYQTYVYKPSNMQRVCANKSIRLFYYRWASNFDDDFFKKICLNKNLPYK